MAGVIPQQFKATTAVKTTNNNTSCNSSFAAEQRQGSKSVHCSCSAYFSFAGQQQQPLLG